MAETGLTEKIGNYDVHYHEAGHGEPLLFIHGSGPGVSAWAYWRQVFPVLSDKYRLYAPDLLGFGESEKPKLTPYGVDVWVQQLIAFIETKEIGPLSIIGNSLGGAIALHLAVQRPDLVKKLVLMGSAGIHFPLTEGLDQVWGYVPSFDNMKKLVELFAFDPHFSNNEDLVQMRYQATLNKENQAAFASMFPAPRQRHVDALALSEQQLRSIDIPVLLLHGREDRIIPIRETSWKLFHLLPKAELHTFSNCGHWTQIEKKEQFCDVVHYFLASKS
ncbi:alpha/beta fold hydrolase [Paenibacillus validus]|uniref:Alpha/beta fold hydrolase n=2 Tax=Paenibacillus TaxID=44249 RepID=A0A7X2ZCE4_9BACL|nr:alpha/beta fold hydrolase [Paenibacillus validus]